MAEVIAPMTPFKFMEKSLDAFGFVVCPYEGPPLLKITSSLWKIPMRRNFRVVRKAKATEVRAQLKLFLDTFGRPAATKATDSRFWFVLEPVKVKHG
jgi:hypothetical protein